MCFTFMVGSLTSSITEVNIRNIQLTASNPRAMALQYFIYMNIKGYLKLTPNCEVWAEQYFGAQSHRFGVNQGKGLAHEFNTRIDLLVDRVKTP